MAHHRSTFVGGVPQSGNRETAAFLVGSPRLIVTVGGGEIAVRAMTGSAEPVGQLSKERGTVDIALGQLQRIPAMITEVPAWNQVGTGPPSVAAEIEFCRSVVARGGGHLGVSDARGPTASRWYNLRLSHHSPGWHSCTSRASPAEVVCLPATRLPLRSTRLAPVCRRRKPTNTRSANLDEVRSER